MPTVAPVVSKKLCFAKASIQIIIYNHFHVVDGVRRSSAKSRRSSASPRLRRAKVEPEGFEPSSKQANIKLSTGLVLSWFSSGSWLRTTDYPAYPFYFGPVQGFPFPILNSIVPSLNKVLGELDSKTSCPTA